MNYKEIAIGVLKREGQVCLTLRQSHQSFAGAWEFPGGKIEASETTEQALKREFKEELGVDTFDWQPLITIPWQYDGFAVRLNVFCTETFQGEPKGCEGQTVRWISIQDLKTIAFPAANQGIVTALQLSDRYLITGDFKNNNEALVRLKRAFSDGISFAQLRAKKMDQARFLSLADQSISLAHQFGAKLLLNGSPDLLKKLPQADGIQLASNKIFDYQTRPIAKNKWLGVSTHTPEEIQQALKIDADFILLSPVKKTNSHPDLQGIGWQTFAEMTENIPIPVFALGGMTLKDIGTAKQYGGQGIAAISEFWFSDKLAGACPRTKNRLQIP
ncbi:Thiamin-phosphate pyrophosphorylase [hydrothermal vent metagenome]|uniref:8-oxo-dGTP diphosphatase n=1 Tax=hydrothermal vent metagenome TaxID=652676 RepID=A0A3B0VSV4_9ZZZZ